MLMLFLQGLLIGFSIAAPVGPIGLLCINRTLASGRMAGLISGTGAALADAFYGSIAGFGLVSISQFLLKQKMAIHIVGGLFLIYLGVKTILASSKPKALTDTANTLWKDFTSTFFLTLTNPTTIISFIAIYASLGIVDADANYVEALVIVLGVFLGSFLWWTFLSTGISLVRHKLSENALKWINVFSGMILIGFGVYAFWSLSSYLQLR